MTDYEKQALDFLNEAEAKMKIEYETTVDGFPFDDKDTLPHKKYKVTLTRKGKEYVFPFYGSYNDWKKKKKPTEYDVLACLQKYDVGPMADFVEEYGYKIVDKLSFNRVMRIWMECRDQYESLLSLFGCKLMEKLCEIN